MWWEFDRGKEGGKEEREEMAGTFPEERQLFLPQES